MTTTDLVTQQYKPALGPGAAPPRFVIIDGPTHSGKTTLLSDLAWQWHDCWDTCLAFASSTEDRTALLRFIQDGRIYTNKRAFTGALQRLRDRFLAQQSDAASAQPPHQQQRVCVIIDHLNFPYGALGRLLAAQPSCFTTIIATVQTVMALPPKLRALVDCAFLLDSANTNEVRRFYRASGVQDLPLSALSTLSTHQSGPYGALVVTRPISGAAGETGGLFWYRADTSTAHGQYLLGRVESLLDMAALAENSVSEDDDAESETLGDTSESDDEQEQEEPDTSADRALAAAGAASLAGAGAASSAPSTEARVASTTNGTSAPDESTQLSRVLQGMDALIRRLDQQMSFVGGGSDTATTSAAMSAAASGGSSNMPASGGSTLSSVLSSAAIAAGTAFGVVVASHVLWG
jgi:hypothetical protein